MLSELLRREKAANIKPDADIDLLMKVEFSSSYRNNELYHIICSTKHLLLLKIREGNGVLFTYLFSIVRHLQWEARKQV
jgi:hypothetical protein